MSKIFEPSTIEMKYTRHFLIRVIASKRHRGHRENYYHLREDQIINSKRRNRFSLDAKHMSYFFGNVQTAVYKLIVAESSYSAADEASSKINKKMYFSRVHKRYT